MTALRTAQAIAAQPPAEHPHVVADISDARALAGLDRVGPSEIQTAAYPRRRRRSPAERNTKIMTARRTAEAIAALAPEHQHTLADIIDAVALAHFDAVGGEILPNAITSGKILIGAVTTAKLPDQAIASSKLATDAVTSPKIAPAAVSEAKIATGAVTESKIADGAVSAGKLQPGIPIGLQDALLDSSELRDYAETSPRRRSAEGRCSWTWRAATCSRSS